MKHVIVFDLARFSCSCSKCNGKIPTREVPRIRKHVTKHSSSNFTYLKRKQKKNGNKNSIFTCTISPPGQVGSKTTSIQIHVPPVNYLLLSFPLFRCNLNCRFSSPNHPFPVLPDTHTQIHTHIRCRYTVVCLGCCYFSPIAVWELFRIFSRFHDLFLCCCCWCNGCAGGSGASDGALRYTQRCTFRHCKSKPEQARATSNLKMFWFCFLATHREGTKVTTLVLVVMRVQ